MSEQDYYAAFEFMGCIGIYGESKVASLRSDGFDVEIVNIDSRGRIIVSKKMKQFASLGDKVVIIGVGECIELLNPVDYEVQSKMGKAIFDSLRGN